MDDLSEMLRTAMQEVSAQNENGMRLGQKRYTTVAVRVEVFRKVFGMRGRIRTEMLHADAETVIMQAHVEFWQDGAWQAYANGYAEERRNASPVNRTSAIENCETSAVGRALANLGLHGGEYASANEVENAIRQQGQPDRKPEPKAGKAAMISAEQALNLHALADEVGADVGKMLDFFHVASLDELPANEYARAIKMLEKKRQGAA